MFPGPAGSSPLPSAPPVAISPRPVWSASRGFAPAAPPLVGGGGLNAPREDFILRRRSTRSCSGLRPPRGGRAAAGLACLGVGPCRLAAASVPPVWHLCRAVPRPVARWRWQAFRPSSMVLCGLRAKGPLPGAGLRPSLPWPMASGRRRLSRDLAMFGRLQARLLWGPRAGRVRRPPRLTGLRPFTPARKLSRGILLSRRRRRCFAGLRPFTPARRRSLGVLWMVCMSCMFLVAPRHGATFVAYRFCMRVVKRSHT